MVELSRFHPTDPNINHSMRACGVIAMRTPGPELIERDRVEGYTRPASLMGRGARRAAPIAHAT